MADLPAWTVQKRTTTGDDLVELSDIKDWVRIVGDDQDTILRTIKDTVHEVFEEQFGRATKKGTYRLVFKNVLPARATVELPRPPLVTLDKVEEYNVGDDTWDTVDASDYLVVDDGGETPAQVEPTGTWPANRLRFEYTAGYAAGDEPSQLDSALLELAAHHYEHRGDAEAPVIPPQLFQKYGGLRVVWQ